MFIALQQGRQETVTSVLEDKKKEIQKELCNDMYEHADTNYLSKAVDIKVLVWLSSTV